MYWFSRVASERARLYEAFLGLLPSERFYDALLGPIPPMTLWVGVPHDALMGSSPCMAVYRHTRIELGRGELQL